MIFAREKLDTYSEAHALLTAHYQEVAHYQDIELDPDYEGYAALEQAGALRIYTARTDGKLIGYAVYIVRHNLHYRSSLQAVQDVLFIHQVHRGRGMIFIDWCDQQLKAEGVAVVYQHVKVKLDYGPALAKLGYEPIDHIYGRRLDK